MISIPFDSHKFEKDFTVFPDEIENDPWVMYHGTTSCNSTSIEQNGFIWGDGTVSKSEIQKIVGVYTRMNWCGTDTSSLNVLVNFSLGQDFGENDSSVIYFAETSKRALLYANRLFAGGEKLYGVRNSIGQLQRYLNDPKVRQAHWKYMKSEYDSLVFNNAMSPEASRPVEVDLTWLSSQLSLMSETHSVAENAYQQHEHGIIYAVKVDERDLETLELHRTMGIKSKDLISPSKIIGKAIIPAEYIHSSPGRSSKEVFKLLAFTTGIYANLSQRKR